MKHITTLNLIPTAPFDFDSTFHKPDHFTTGDNAWEPGTRWQTFPWQQVPLGLVIKNAGTVDQPAVQIDIHHDAPLDEAFLSSFTAEFRYRYNFDLDLSGFYAAFAADPVLGPVITRWRGMRPGHPSSLYEYLIIGIVLQNATVRRSIQMFAALLDHYGTPLNFDGQTLGCFWNPGDLTPVTEEELRALKMGYRAKSIKRIDDYFARGEIDEMALRALDRDTQMKALLNLYGVGPATVWYLLFDVFHHWDFFNHISPWEQKIYSKLFFDQDPENPVPVERLLDHFEQYGPYKQLAVHYLWEDLWWQHHHAPLEWFGKLIRT